VKEDYIQPMRESISVGVREAVSEADFIDTASYWACVDHLNTAEDEIKRLRNIICVASNYVSLSSFRANIPKKVLTEYKAMMKDIALVKSEMTENV